jgi:outer membrane protein assembly factor BamB
MTRLAPAILLATLCGTLLTPAVHAADPAPKKNTAPVTAPPADQWPISRGNPQLQGLAAGHIPDDPQLLWSFKTDGPVKSSAVIANTSGGRVYIGSDDNNIYCLDLATGNKLWAFKTKDAVEAPPTLSAKGDLLFVGSDDSFVYCLDAATGAEKWKYECGDKVTAAPNLAKLTDGREIVVVGSHDMFLHALDASTGKLIWKFETENFINAAAAIENGVAIFGGCDGLLHVVNIADGKQVKQIDIGGYVAGNVALVGHHCFVGHFGNAFVGIDIEADETMWEFTSKKLPFYSSPAVTSDRVVFGGRDKRVHCVKRDNGPRRPAPPPSPAPADQSTPSTFSDAPKGRAPEPTPTPAPATPETPKAPEFLPAVAPAIWSTPTRNKVDSSPVIIDNKVVVGCDDGRLYILSLTDGKKLWDYEIGKPVNSSPAIASGIIVIGSDDGSVYAFGEKKK